MNIKWPLIFASCSCISGIFALVIASMGIAMVAFVAIATSAIFSAGCVVALFSINSMITHKSELLSDISIHQKASIAQAADRSKSNNITEQINMESATTIEDGNVEEPHRDDESGLLSGNFFPIYLEQRITAARRTLRPISLIIVELDGLERNDSGKKSDYSFFISAVGDVVKRTLRESDCAFRLAKNVFAAVMDDTTESGAVWAAERVRGVLHTGALAGRVTVSAGVACYPSHALEPEDLINSAQDALNRAKERGVDQVEIAADQ